MRTRKASTPRILLFTALVLVLLYSFVAIYLHSLGMDIHFTR